MSSAIGGGQGGDFQSTVRYRGANSELSGNFDGTKFDDCVVCCLSPGMYRTVQHFKGNRKKCIESVITSVIPMTSYDSSHVLVL